MEQELQKLHNILKNTSLTHDERARLRARMATVLLEHPTRESLPMYQQLLQHGMQIVLSAFLFALFVGGSVSVIADNALPGDPLYSFKVNVNEKVKGAFLTTPAKKAAYQTSRIEERLSEVQTLAESKTLTPEKKETAQKALDSHLTELSQELQKTDPNAALAVTDTLKAALTAKKDAVTTNDMTTLSANDKAQVIGTYNTAIAGVSNQQVQIISKQVDSITNEILSTPTPDALGTIDGTATTDASGTSETTTTNSTSTSNSTGTDETNTQTTDSTKLNTTIKTNPSKSNSKTATPASP